MSTETSTTWICNRCGTRKQIKHGGRRTTPRNWIEVMFQVVGTKEETNLGHLCNPCGGLLVSFTNGTLKEDLERQELLAKYTGEGDGE